MYFCNTFAWLKSTEKWSLFHFCSHVSSFCLIPFDSHLWLFFSSIQSFFMQIKANYIYIYKILHTSLKTSILYTHFCALLFFPLTVYLREFPTSLNKSFSYSFFRIHGGHDWATFTHSLTHTFSIVWVEYNWFNHLSIERHWSCFHLLLIQMMLPWKPGPVSFTWVQAYLSGKFSKEEWLAQKICAFVILINIASCPPRWE